MQWKRLQLDIPAELAPKLKVLAAQKGIPQKRLVADLIEDACSSVKIPKPQKARAKKTRKRNPKNGSKK